MAKDLVPIYLPVKYQSPAQKRVGSAFKAGVKFKNQASNIGKKSGRDLTNRQIGQMTDYYFDD
jgi:hypothetical protein